MRTIVAIGGGVIRTRGTAAIDQEIIRLSGRKRPKLLFVPTASSDSERYCRNVCHYFGDFWGCRVDMLLLLNGTPPRAEIARKISSADIIYVGGGNSLKMLRRWRRLGVDRMLRTAYHRGTVLSGISAGSICWFEAGHSDSMSFYNPRRWTYIKVKGIGLLRGIHCPHYDSTTRRVPRRNDFQRMIVRTGGFGVAIENNCAIAFVGRTYRVIASKPRAGAYRVYKSRGKVISERIEQREKLSPIADLYRKRTGRRSR